MFKDGDVIDGKYVVKGKCSDAGGMGTVLHVTPVKKVTARDRIAEGAEIERESESGGERIVLKYCKQPDEEQVRRFQREVRILEALKGNALVVKIVDSNLDHSPPYFVMKFYPDGDLTTLKLKGDEKLQEVVFGQMIDCLHELHSRNLFHRDVKPQNFLRDGARVVVADFGLGTDLAQSHFTRSSAWWGTPGYLPPEFLLGQGGFKNADATSDVFMLGKTMYNLLTGNDPQYVMKDGQIPAPLFHVISRCCELDKAGRYQSLTELRQSLASAFDAVLGRTSGPGKAMHLLEKVTNLLKTANQFDVKELTEFIDTLGTLGDDFQNTVCLELIDDRLFGALGHEAMKAHLERFLAIYARMVVASGYGWSYAETIATNMARLFRSQHVPDKLKVKALDLAVFAAHHQNRFAAMSTCRDMLASVRDEGLGMLLAELLKAPYADFLRAMEPTACKSDAIIKTLSKLQGGKK